MSRKAKKITELILVLVLVLGFSATPVFAAQQDRDTTAPFVVSISPSDRDNQVSTDAQIIISFSEDIVINNDQGIRVTDSAGEVPSYYYPSNNRKIAIVPKHNWLPTQQYTVEIAENTVSDNAGNQMREYSSKFTTNKDYVCPAIAGVEPSRNENGVFKKEEIRIEFSEKIEAANSVTTAQILYGDGEIITVPAAVSDSGYEMTLKAPELNVGEMFTLDILSATVKDGSVNLNREIQIPFTIIEDKTPPDSDLTLNSDGSIYINAYDEYGIEKIRCLVNGLIVVEVLDQDYCYVPPLPNGANVKVIVTDKNDNPKERNFTILK